MDVPADKPSPFKASFTGLPIIAVALLLMLLAAVTGFRTLLVSHVLPLMEKTSVSVWELLYSGCSLKITAVQGKGEGGAVYIVQTVLLPIVLAVVLLQLVVKNGKKWVDRPQLCQDMSQPW